MIKKIALLLTLAPAITFAQQKNNHVPVKNAQAGPILKSKVDSVSYAFGLKIAGDLKAHGVESLNYALWSKAMEQVFKGDKTEMTDDQAQNTITQCRS